jgi:lysophospholipase-3
MEQLVYWDGNFSETPQVVSGDGDGMLPAASILALDTVIGGDSRQEYYKSIKLAGTSHAGVVSDAYYKSIKLAGTSHAGVVSDAAALKRVVDEVLWSTPV